MKQRMNFPAIVKTIGFVALLIGNWLGNGDNLKGQEGSDPIRLPPEELVLKFVDQAGEPIPDITINGNSLVFEGLASGSFGAHLTNSQGGVPTSDSLGVAICQVPDFGLGNLFRFRLNTHHEDFLDYDDFVRIDSNGPTQVVLQRGIRIAATVVDAETGKRITQNLFGIASQDKGRALRDWRLMENGTLLSPALPRMAQRVRLVQIEHGVPIRFSQPLDIDRDDGGRALLKDIPMQTALSILGKLDDIVPRPIINGRLQFCVAWPLPAELESGDLAGHWYDTVPIAQDGTFRIEGIPLGDWLQVVATCDGWENQASHEALRRLVYPALDLRVDATLRPHLVPLQPLPESINLLMRPRRTIKLSIMDEQGHQVPGQEVSIRDYSFLAHGNLQRNTRVELLSARREEVAEYNYSIDRQFTTDAFGCAVIPNYPNERVFLSVRGADLIKPKIEMPFSLLPPPEGDEIVLQIKKQ